MVNNCAPAYFIIARPDCARFHVCFMVLPYVNSIFGVPRVSPIVQKDCGFGRRWSFCVSGPRHVSWLPGPMEKLQYDWLGYTRCLLHRPWVSVAVLSVAKIWGTQSAAQRRPFSSCPAFSSSQQEIHHHHPKCGWASGPWRPRSENLVWNTWLALWTSMYELYMYTCGKG